MTIDKFDHNPVLVNINKLKPYIFVEDHTFRHVLAKPNDCLLTKLVETTHSNNLFIKQPFETTHFGNLFIKESVETNHYGNLFIE